MRNFVIFLLIIVIMVLFGCIYLIYYPIVLEQQVTIGEQQEIIEHLNIIIDEQNDRIYFDEKVLQALVEYADIDIVAFEEWWNANN